MITYTSNYYQLMTRKIIIYIVYLVFRYTYIMLCSEGKHQ